MDQNQYHMTSRSKNVIWSTKLNEVCLILDNGRVLEVMILKIYVDSNDVFCGEHFTVERLESCNESS